MRATIVQAIVAGIEAILDELDARVPKAQVRLFSVFRAGWSGADYAGGGQPPVGRFSCRACPDAGPERAMPRSLQRLSRSSKRAWKSARPSLQLVDIREQFYTDSGELNADLYYHDLLHLSTQGYQTWWAALEPHVSAVLDEPALAPNPHRAVQSAPRGGPRHEQKLQEVTEDDYQLVFVGDSITHFWERDDDFGWPVWERYYAHRKALNLGFGGDRTEWVNWRLQNGEVAGLDPKLVVLMIGTNNTHVGEDAPEETLAGIASNVRTIRAQLPNAQVLLLSIFPRGEGPEDPLRQLNEQVNARLPELAAADPAVTHLDINQHFLDDDGRLPRA